MRAVALYRALALIVLNTAILFACGELGANLLFDRLDAEYRQDLPYYASRDWGETYWREHRQREMRYRSYVAWMHAPLDGELIQLDENGLRRTPGARCEPEALIVVTLGGSTMLGVGAPDWGTIPAYLQGLLAERTSEPVCVRNLGQPAYTSTQSLVLFLTRLQRGDVPDLLISYEGVNDIGAANQTGRAGEHQNLARIADRFEERTHPLVRWFRTTAWYEFFDRALGLRPRVSYATLGVDARELADSIVDVYVSNLRIASALGREYGFEVAFFWQPMVTTKSPRAPREDELVRAMAPAAAALYEATYRSVERRAHEHPDLYDFQSALDGEGEVLIDPWHLVPDGNERIAREIVRVLDQRAGR